MADIQATRLPGVGIRHDFETASGDRIGMISHPTGRRELLIYDRDDPDSCRSVLRLEEDDVRMLGELVGGEPKVSEHVASLQSVPGLTIDWLPVSKQSECSGRTAGEIGARDDIGASIVAVIRGDETIPSPPSDFRLRDGDTAVAVGTTEGVRRLFALLQGEH